MPNQLTFAVPIALPDLKYASVTVGREINDTTKRLIIDISIYGDDNFKHPNIFSVLVTNGSLSKVEVVEEPDTSQDVVRMATQPLTAADNANIATAFDRVMTAFVTQGNTGILNELQALGALPAGTAA